MIGAQKLSAAAENDSVSLALSDAGAIERGGS
jgi:hypothetical protein